MNLQTEPIAQTVNCAAPLFIDLFREFNASDGIENAHSKGTLYKYENITNNFASFLQELGIVNLEIRDLNVPLVKGFVQWLPTHLKSCNRTHLSKHVSRIRKAAGYAVEFGYIGHNPIAGYHVKRAKNKQIVHLEDQEFTRWTSAQWHNKVYQLAQDLYSFQMVTGLAYGDLFSYKTVIDRNTGIWIEGIRSKTKKPFYIPLFHQDFELARAIHEKYKGKLPYIENHVYNRYIREMAAVLGIEKYLTTHVGRKTFATLKDQAGWNVGPISSMMGNSEKVCAQHYIGTSKSKILVEINRLS